MRQLLVKTQASAPAIIPLENDIRCGPLLPSAGLSARMRFMALRTGVHSIDGLRISGTGGDNEYEHLVSYVLSFLISYLAYRG